MRPSCAEIATLLAYDRTTGQLRWRVDRGSRKFCGKIAGTREKSGRVRVIVKGKKYLATHLIWAIVKGRWPKRFIDHRDCDQSNNRFSNLREATRAQNNANCRRRNRTGYKGVYKNRKGRLFTAQIGRERLGSFLTAAAAGRAYARAARSKYGEFARV